MRESGDGVGLGLALVRQIARHHGGEARCHPREGGGSLFEVLLPLTASAGSQTGRALAEPARVRRAERRTSRAASMVTPSTPGAVTLARDLERPEPRAILTAGARRWENVSLT
jgi:hypothetical protein